MNSDKMAPTKRLLSSIRRGKSKKVKSLLKSLCLSQSLDTLGTALLRYSAKHGNVKLVKYLLHEGCDKYVDVPDSKGRTALMWAVQRKHPHVVDHLLAAEADPLALNHENESALQMVCFERHIDLNSMQAFLHGFRHGCSSSEEAARKLIDAGCQLYQAVFTTDPKVVEYMLERGFPVGSELTGANATALHVAASLNDLKTAKVLLKYGADATAMDFKGDAPVSIVYKRHDAEHSAEKVELLRLLLSRGVSPTTCNAEGAFQAKNALYNGDSQAIAALLPYLDFKVKDQRNDSNALHYLAENRNPGVTDELKVYSRELVVDAVTKQGRAPLHLAAKRGNARMVEFLLDRGADVDKANTAARGRTALFYATARAQPKLNGDYDRCVEVLLQRGADPQWRQEGDEWVTIFGAAYRDGRRGRKRMEAVLARLAMLQLLGIPINEIKIPERRYGKLCKYFVRCRRVLEEEVHGNVTIFKLLTESDEKLEKRAGNEGLLLKLKRLGDKPRVRSSFTYYYNTLAKRFEKAIQKRRLKNAAGTGVCKLFGGRVDRAHVVVSKVIEYLDDHDLRQLCEL